MTDKAGKTKASSEQTVVASARHQHFMVSIALINNAIDPVSLLSPAGFLIENLLSY